MRALAVRALPLLVVLGVGPAVSIAGCTDPRSPASQASETSTTSAPAATPLPQETSSPAESLIAGRYQPLWPFSTPDEAAAWQRSYRAGGGEPWHLDARRTAIAFSHDYLGFTEIDRAVKTVQEGEHARVHVGFRAEEGPKPLVAAVVHLMRYGSGKDAPWEVVGTDDTTFTLTRPAYGATATSPLAVGGRITGVDESIRVQVRHPGSAHPVGEQCCMSAGGENAAWAGEVAFEAEPGRTLTVVASTGGHIAAVERFAVTGVTQPR